MTPNACVIQDAMNEVEKLTDSTFIAISKKLKKSFKSIVGLYKEAICDNSVLVKRIFIASFVKEVRIKVMSDYIGIPSKTLSMSPDLESIEKLTLFMMTCESLAEIYEIVKISFGLSPKEFVISWHMMNETNELKDLFFRMEFNPDILDEKTRKYYLEEKRAQKAEAEFKDSQEAKK